VLRNAGVPLATQQAVALIAIPWHGARQELIYRLEGDGVRVAGSRQPERVADQVEPFLVDRITLVGRLNLADTAFTSTRNSWSASRLI
jgi:hypothetical protein